MSLFEKCLKFHLIGITSTERRIYEHLIKSNGGEVTDDDETIVKFTSKDAYVRNSYVHIVRTKIYNVEFILGCVEEGKIIETKQFRLNPIVEGDEFFIQHFLCGMCPLAIENTVRENHSCGNFMAPTQASSDNRHDSLSSNSCDSMFTALTSQTAFQFYGDESNDKKINSENMKNLSETRAGLSDTENSTESEVIKISDDSYES